MSARWVTFCYIVVIVFLHVFPAGSVLTGDQRSWNGFELDYLVHVFLFLPWMGLVRFSKRELKKKENGYQINDWTWLVVGLLVAAGAEILQYFLAYRVFNPVDLGLNVFGVLLGGVVIYFWNGKGFSV